jgi:hypothetical protein
MIFDAFFNHIYVKRAIATGIDFTIECVGALLGGYFGAMVAALVIVMTEANPRITQKAMWTGMVAGFLFWGITTSWMNRVLIQGISRSSIGKKLMQLELVSYGAPISWKSMMRHWVTGSLISELTVVSSLETDKLAPVIPLKPKTVQDQSNEKKAA